MGMFGDLMKKIFQREDAPGPRPAGIPHQAPRGGSAVPGTPAAKPLETRAATATATAEPVDVELILDGLLAQQKSKLDWRHSIVDLMKLVGMDSSLENRKELAEELKYTGDRNDSATMNIWLHKQVMKKLSENGGKVPANLLD